MPAGVVMFVAEESSPQSLAAMRNEALFRGRDSVAEFFLKRCVGECLTQNPHLSCRKSVSSSRCRY